MKRGEIYFANLDPTVGSEVKKKRPVLIVSNNANNKAATIVTIIPLTSNTKKVFAFEVMLDPKDSGLTKPSKAQCNQIRAISKFRIEGRKAGIANNGIMSRINSAIKLHLDLEF